MSKDIILRHYNYLVKNLKSNPKLPEIFTIDREEQNFDKKIQLIVDFLIKQNKVIIETLLKFQVISRHEVREQIHFYKNFNLYVLPSEDSLYKKDHFTVSSKELNYLNIIDKHFFNTRSEIFSNVTFLPVEQINNFLNIFEDQIKDLNFKDFAKTISVNQDIVWTNDLIIRFKDIWDWDELHKNPKIDWNFVLIKECKNYLNWAYISSYPHLKWKKKDILRYKNELIFNAFYDPEFPQKNEVGEEHCISEQQNYPYFQNNHVYEHLEGSLSLSEGPVWSTEILDIPEVWNWEELSRNEFIEWDYKLIKRYEEKLNFKLLSRNVKCKWTIELINDFLQKWDWENLSGNPSLPWDENFITMYEEKWTWVHKYQKSSFENDRTELEHLAYNYHKLFTPSLSSNSGITWTISLLKKYFNKIDFWHASRNCKFSDNALFNYFDVFTPSKRIGGHGFRKSGDREYLRIYRTAWENFALNENFILSINNVRFCYINFCIAHGDFSDGYEEKNERFLQVVRNSNIENIKLDEIIEEKWGNLLFNDNFINKYIFSKLVKPIFNSKFKYHYLRLMEKKY